MMKNRKVILRLLFHHISSAETSHELAHRGIERLFNLCEERYGQQSIDELERL